MLQIEVYNNVCMCINIIAFQPFVVHFEMQCYQFSWHWNYILVMSLRQCLLKASEHFTDNAEA